MFQRHLTGVSNALLHEQSSARAERIHRKIHEVRTVGRGYRKFVNSGFAILFSAETYIHNIRGRTMFCNHYEVLEKLIIHTENMPSNTLRTTLTFNIWTFGRGATWMLFSIALFTSCGMSDEIRLFNGESLEGWEGPPTVFRVEQGAIIGGTLEVPLDETGYLCTEETYDNFILTLSAKFVTHGANINGGISFRAKRVTNSNEVMGYQADIGYLDSNAIPIFSDYTPADTTGLYPLWGSLVDENRDDITRYPRPDIFPAIILKVAKKELIEEIIDPYDWNEIAIKASGIEIEIKINGVTTAEFAETYDIPSNGSICLQAHSGGPYEIWYQDIVLNQL